MTAKEPYIVTFEKMGELLRDGKDYPLWETNTKEWLCQVPSEPYAASHDNVWRVWMMDVEYIVKFRPEFMFEYRKKSGAIIRFNFAKLSYMLDEARERLLVSLEDR